jgi:hypothetical protein
MNARLKKVLSENQETAAPALLAALLICDAIDSAADRITGTRLMGSDEAFQVFGQTLVDTLQAEAAKRRAA